MKKLFLLLFLLLVFSSSSFAALFDSTKNLKVLETTHFDIYFSPQSDTEFAKEVATKAEKALKYASEEFGIESYLRSYPIVITSDIEDLNAYYSPLSLNHIVLYNGASSDYELSYSSDTTYSIILHELVHQLTLNNLSGFKASIQSIFGDPANNSFVLNNFVTEGLAVMIESSSGESRINDPFVMHSVIDGIRNNNIYSYYLSSGAVTRYPSANTYYIYSAMFFRYIKEKYGPDKFKEMIRKMSFYISFPSLFKSTYDISLSRAIKEFNATFPKDEFSKPTRFVKNPARYSSLFTDDKNLYFADNTEHYVYCFSDDATDAKKILSTLSPESIKVSLNSKYLALLESVNLKNVLKIYDIQSGKTKHIKDYKNVHDMCFLSLSGVDYIALYKHSDNKTFIEIYNLADDSLYKSFDLSGLRIYSMTEINNERIAFILSNNLKFNVVILDVNKGSFRRIENADDYIIRYLSFNKDKKSLSFSYVSKNISQENQKAPRYAEYVINSDTSVTFYKSELVLSGGIINPVNIGDNIIFISRHYKNDYISYIKKAELSLSSKSAKASDFSFNVKGRTSSSNLTEYDFKSYNPFLSSLPFNGNNKAFLYPYPVVDKGVGVSLNYLTTEPTEQFSSLLSLSYIITENPRLEFLFKETVQTRPMVMSLNIKPSLKFDKIDGDDETYFDFLVSADASYIKYFSHSNNYLSISLSMGFDMEAKDSSEYRADGLYLIGDFYYQDIMPRGFGFNEKEGYSLELFTKFTDINNYFKFSSYTNIIEPSLAFVGSYYIPSLLPFNNTRNFTSNMPLKLSLYASYHYNMEETNKKSQEHNVVAGLQARLTLFSLNLSESLFDFPFVFNNFVFDFLPSAEYQYYSEFENGAEKKYDGFVFSFKADAYFRISLSTFGKYITQNYFDIGFRGDFCQEEPSASFKFKGSLILKFMIDRLFVI